MPDGSAVAIIDNKKAEPTPAGGIPSNSMAQAQRINSTTNSIQQADENVNGDSQYSLRTTIPATARDYLLTMRENSLSTAGEKDAMSRYAALNMVYSDYYKGRVTMAWPTKNFLPTWRRHFFSTAMP